MTPHDIKKALLEKWHACRDTLCDTASKIGDKTKEK